ncbi:YcnI family protein [Blastococcus sp. SYSU D00820]
MSLALPRPLARLGVVLLAALAALAASFALAAGTAAAHVTVSSADAAAGGYGKLTFRVPNESDTASTVSVAIRFPAETPLASLRSQPVPGWTATLTVMDLDEPVEVAGQEVTSYVSTVEWRADAGGGIRPGEFQEFSLSGGPFPEADELVLPAVQTYSDGTEAAWIEPTVTGQAEPEYPAPVLTLSGTATGDGHDGSTTDGHAGTDTAAAHGDAAEDPGAVALFLAILALLTGLAAVVLGVRAGRRTVSS